MDKEDDYLEGCSVNQKKEPTPDSKAPYVVLFAEVPEEEIPKMAQKWKEVFGA